MLDHINKILSVKISAFRKGYIPQHVLLKLNEEWRKHLDNNQVVGAILMDLSKAFDCISHELLIAKLSAYVLIKRPSNYFCPTSKAESKK